MITPLLFLSLNILVRSQDDSYQQAPFVRYEPQDVIVSKGERVKLACGVMGYPPPTVEWYKDNKLFEINTRSTQLPDNSLDITAVRRNSQQNDGGLYYCVATNKAGRYASRNATVIVKYLAKTFLLVPQNVTLSVRDSHTFKCIPPPGYPTPKVYWYKNGVPLRMDVNLEAKQVVNEYQLHITMASYNNIGLYTCVARNSEDERISSPAELKFKVTKPDVQIYNREILVYEGRDATIACETLKLPQPTRKWSKVGGTMPPSSRIEKTDDGILKIVKTEISDSGDYKCLAKNQVGEDSTIGRLNVYKQPDFEIMPSAIKIGEGQKAIFDCVIKGGKSPSIHWEHKGSVYLKSSWKVRIFVNEQNQLVIPNVRPGDEGAVECNAKDFGMTIKSDVVLLSVLKSVGAPPSITLSPSTITAREGGSFTLSCKGSGTLTFAWYLAAKNQMILSTTSGVKMKSTSDESNLTFSNIRISDSGVYRCKVTGSSGTATQLSHVTVVASDADTPSQIENVKVTDIKATSVKLSWNEPITNSLAPVTSYVITIVDKNTFLEKKIVYLNVALPVKIVKDLKPSTVYTFSVAAHNKNGEGMKRNTHAIETLAMSATPDPDVTVDKLENVDLKLTIESITFDTIKFSWNYIQPSRITSYLLYYKYQKDGKQLTGQKIISNTAVSYSLSDEKVLTETTKYEFYIQAVNNQYVSKKSQTVIVPFTKLLIPAPKVGMQKIDDQNLQVYWEPPVNFKDIQGVESFEITCLYFNTKKIFHKFTAPKEGTRSTISGLDRWMTYEVFISIKTDKGTGLPSTSQVITLGKMEVGEVKGFMLKTVPTDNKPKKEKKGEDDDGGFIAIVKKPWFIATVGVLVWLFLLVIVALICCRRRRKKQRKNRFENRRGLLDHTHPDYPNTSLNRRNDTYNPAYNPSYAGSHKKRGLCHCCKSQSSSIDDDFPNRADIKPLMTYTKHEGVETRNKSSDLKETNIGLAMKNGYMVDTPLNNELDFRNQSDNRLYDSGDDRGRFRMPHEQAQVAPNSGSMARREQRYQTDSVERRHAEIVRTAAPKTFPDSELVNVMENNPQATWKQDASKSPRANKPPGENTLRRQGKTQFKPLPKLEVLNWADGLPNSSKANSTNNGSEPSSPKLSSSASMFSENADHHRTNSRMSHGGSSNSLNKYPRRRRNSNASSMMSSELYQSEMDPSGYSDVVSDRKRKKEKVPPPIDLDGLTSDILLQWAESVTNSSPSSSGSSSPDRLSGISSEGSIYTDEDFAQAVAAVVECGGFNMDYDYSLPGMPGAQPPVLTNRNTKYNKIDQVLAQRSKLRNSPAGSKVRESPATPMSTIPHISMSGYLTGSQKGPQSTHSAPSGIPRASSKYKSSTPIDKSRYGTGFQDIDSVSTASAKPLTMSNLMQHEQDSSLEREKKNGAKPLTVSNLRQHETSLDRQQIRQQAPAPLERVPSRDRNEYNSMHNSNPVLMPEAALSSMSALERNESLNSKDSINSSNRHDSEVENNTSERKPKTKKQVLNLRDPHSSTSTVSTVRTSPDHGDDTDC